jgi:DNA modification methylase
MYQDAVRVAASEATKKRVQKLSPNDHVRSPSRSGSGLRRRLANWVGRETVYPSNVLTLAPTCFDTKHSAAFPVELPTWFIKLFSRPGDLVIDPFLGSGTTAVAALQQDRCYLGIEVIAKYCALARHRLALAAGRPAKTGTEPVADNADHVQEADRESLLELLEPMDSQSADPAQARRDS